jgi:hypothetical protein
MPRTHFSFGLWKRKRKKRDVGAIRRRHNTFVDWGLTGNWCVGWKAAPVTSGDSVSGRCRQFLFERDGL